MGVTAPIRKENRFDWVLACLGEARDPRLPKRGWLTLVLETKVFDPRLEDEGDLRLQDEGS